MFDGLGLGGEFLGEAGGDFARADGVGVAAGRDFAGDIGGCHQRGLECLDLFQSQCAGFALETLHALCRGFGGAHEVVDLRLMRDQTKRAVGVFDRLGHGCSR